MNEINSNMKVSPNKYCLGKIIQESNLRGMKNYTTEMFKISKLGGKSNSESEG